MANVKNVALNYGLTHYARGVKFKGHIHQELFPTILVDHLTGKYWDFGYGDFGIETRGPVALDVPYLEMEWDIQTKDFEINNYGLVTRVGDLENANASNMLMLPRKKIRRGMRISTTLRELEARDHFYREASYKTTANGGTVSGTEDHVLDQAATAWNADGSDPRVAVNIAKDMIRQKIGVEGNSIIIPADVRRRALSINKLMREGHQYVREGPITLAAIAAQFEIEPGNIHIGSPIFNAATKGQPKDMNDIWSRHCVVFYKEDMPEGGNPPEDAGTAACFKLRGWEKIRVVESEIANPPGMMYVLQDPYDMEIINYESAVFIPNCIPVY